MILFSSVVILDDSGTFCEKLFITGHTRNLMGNPKTGKPESGIRNPESQIIVLPIQRVKTILNIKTNLRPKNVCLGLIRPKVSFYECLGYFLLSVLVKQ